MNKEKITIVGVARNVEHTICEDFDLIIRAFESFEIERMIVIESDSTDNTLVVLKELESKYKNLVFKSEGRLANRIPDRIERIRYCRNLYVEEIRRLNLESKYVIVSDLDGINSRLKKRYVEECFIESDWDAVFPNQLFGYYDILALRQDFWVNHSCIEELKWRQSFVYSKSTRLNFIRSVSLFFQYDRARKQAFYSKMLRINRNLPRIPVKSAFGGIGIYKSEIFTNFDYSPIENATHCEHVDLHLKMHNSGYRLFIQPGFINNYFNTYNINKVLFIRIIRKLVWNNKLLYDLQKRIAKILGVK